MRRHLIAAVAALAAVGSSAAQAQDVHPAALPKGHYAALDGLPDWGGVWVWEGSRAVLRGAAVAGGIGFVGLLVPHLLRPFVGQRPGALLWPSLLGGAGLLLAADIGARAAPLLLPLAAEPRLGVLTALIGAPFLVAAARRVVP